MATSITLDDDLLAAARAEAERRQQTVEAFVADVLRDRLAAVQEPRYRNGIRLFPTRPDEPPVTDELVQRLMRETE